MTTPPTGIHVVCPFCGHAHIAVSLDGHPLDRRQTVNCACGSALFEEQITDDAGDTSPVWMAMPPDVVQRTREEIMEDKRRWALN